MKPIRVPINWLVGPLAVLVATFCLFGQATRTPEELRGLVESAEIAQADGRSPDALSAYDLAISGGVEGYYLQVALFNKATLCISASRPEEAADAIRRLRSEFPDSSFAIQAGILNDAVQGKSTQQAEALYQQEVEASRLCEQAMPAIKEKQDSTALSALERLIGQYPGTAAELRAHDLRGHLLIRNNRRGEAIQSFETILSQIGTEAPRSSIVRKAKIRLAALYHSSGRKTEALAMY